MLWVNEKPLWLWKALRPLHLITQDSGRTAGSEERAEAGFSHGSSKHLSSHHSEGIKDTRTQRLGWRDHDARRAKPDSQGTRPWKQWRPQPPSVTTELPGASRGQFTQMRNGGFPESCKHFATYANLKKWLSQEITIKIVIYGVAIIFNLCNFSISWWRVSAHGRGPVRIREKGKA